MSHPVLLSLPGPELQTSWKVALVAFSVTCEVFKQCTNFATRYFADDGEYPVPMTALVLGVEVIKLVSVGVVLVRTGDDVMNH